MKREQSTLDTFFKKPKPQVRESDHYVTLPCSKYNISYRTDNPIQKWYVIKNLLLETIYDVKDLIDVLKESNTTCRKMSDFENLESVMSNDFITNTLPWMQSFALKLPEICPYPIPFLRTGMDDEITLTQEQCACLLVHAFFCTFPHRADTFPSINFHGLYRRGSRPSNKEKLKCLLNYFEMISTSMPKGKVTFKRQCLLDMPDWESSRKKLCSIELIDQGSIEDSPSEYAQVDFANSEIGGGVIGNGCVQEEIRFIISPECIVSRLFMEEMDENEAIIITGSKRYSDFRGYADTFQYLGPYIDDTLMDFKSRVDCEIIAIDAVNFKFGNPEKQFKQSVIDRELNKAYVGFYTETSEKLLASGLWGCGVFLGNKELKTLIQIMAASITKRKGLRLYTYGNPEFMKDLKQLCTILDMLGVTIGELYGYITTKPDEKTLFEHIRDSIAHSSQDF